MTCWTGSCDIGATSSRSAAIHAINSINVSQLICCRHEGRFCMQMTMQQKTVQGRCLQGNQQQEGLQGLRTNVKHMNCRNWSSIHEKKHVVIHLPSLGLTEGQRQGLSKPHVRENSQMARLCDLSDPLVEVLYVAPFNVPEVSILPIAVPFQLCLLPLAMLYGTTGLCQALSQHSAHCSSLPMLPSAPYHALWHCRAVSRTQLHALTFADCWS